MAWSCRYLSSLDGPAKQRGVNVINKHDMGREIQLSFYSGRKCSCPSASTICPPACTAFSCRRSAANPYNPPTEAHPEGACPPGLFGPSGWPWNPIGAVSRPFHLGTGPY
jgi:hypothetical protein